MMRDEGMEQQELEDMNFDIKMQEFSRLPELIRIYHVQKQAKKSEEEAK